MRYVFHKTSSVTPVITLYASGLRNPPKTPEHLELELAPENYRLKLSSLPKVCPDKNFKFRVTGPPASARTRHVAPVAVGSPGRSPETGPPTASGAVYVDHRQLGNVGDAPVRVVVDVHPSRAAVAEPVAG